MNDAGKSSVLEALYLLFSWFIARMQSESGRGKDIPKDSDNPCLIKTIF